MRYRHIALFTGPGLRGAEGYYAGLFGMEVILREGPLPDGTWAELPRDRSWDDAEAAGAAIGMVALRRDDVVLALFAAEPTGSQVMAIGILATPGQIADVAGRLSDEIVEGRADGWLAFVDSYGVRWQLAAGAGFTRAGDGEDGRLEV